MRAPGRRQRGAESCAMKPSSCPSPGHDHPPGAFEHPIHRPGEARAEPRGDPLEREPLGAEHLTRIREVGLGTRSPLAPATGVCRAGRPHLRDLAEGSIVERRCNRALSPRAMSAEGRYLEAWCAGLAAAVALHLARSRRIAGLSPAPRRPWATFRELCFRWPARHSPRSRAGCGQRPPKRGAGSTIGGETSSAAAARLGRRSSARQHGEPEQRR